jgi:hypothetical protein
MFELFPLIGRRGEDGLWCGDVEGERERGPREELSLNPVVFVEAREEEESLGL